MQGKPRILSLYSTHLINSIKHEHSCKILFIMGSVRQWLTSLQRTVLFRSVLVMVKLPVDEDMALFHRAKHISFISWNVGHFSQTNCFIGCWEYIPF